MSNAQPVFRVDCVSIDNDFVTLDVRVRAATTWIYYTVKLREGWNFQHHDDEDGSNNIPGFLEGFQKIPRSKGLDKWVVNHG